MKQQVTQLPAIARDIRTSIPDHQILFSFNGDEEAVEFHDWWLQHGIHEYQLHLREQRLLPCGCDPYETDSCPECE